MTQSFQNAARDALRQMVLNARREIPTEPDHAIGTHRADEFLRQALEDAIYNVHVVVDDDGGPPLSDLSHRPTLVAPQATEDPPPSRPEHCPTCQCEPRGPLPEGVPVDPYCPEHGNLPTAYDDCSCERRANRGY